MLHEFLQANREELVARCKAKAAKRNQAPLASNQYGIPRFIDQLIDVLRSEQAPQAGMRQKAAERKPSLALVPSEIVGVSAKRGVELYGQGVTVGQVVHDYGDLCQAMTELAIAKGQPISVDEFHTFNRCSDDAIADAVTAFTSAQLEPAVHKDRDGSGTPGEPLDARRIQVLVEAAVHSFAAIKSGQVAIQGATAKVHEDTLLDLRGLVSRALGDSPGNANAETRG